MEWRLGTMGFSYAAWAGVFYPRNLKPAEYLPYYARSFDTVELDTTFHASPAPAVVQCWAAVTPPEFRFCVKTPREITHDGSLDQTVDQMLRFVDVMRRLGDKLAAVLLQFPPSVGVASLPLLDTFLGRLPDDVRFAVEFRNDSWLTNQTTEMLRARKVAWVAADYLTKPTPVRVTADFLYLRWVGIHGQYRRGSRELIDQASRLQWWKSQLTAAPEHVRTVYGFFNDDYAGYSVESCRQLRKMLGLPARTPAPQELGELFPRV